MAWGGEKMGGVFPAKQLWRYVLSMFSPAKSRKLSAELAGDTKAHSLPDILRLCHKNYGLGGILKADVILFGWALLPIALSDLFLRGFPILRTGLGAALCFFMCHIADEEPLRAFLITAFIVTSCISDGSWVLTALFIILFEHIGVEGTKQ